MKYTFLINQAGVVGEGLLGKVDLQCLCLLNYLEGWSLCARAERIERAGAEFFWIDYDHAIAELPLLLNPQAKVETRKNSLCGLVSKLRRAGLIETIKHGRRLFFRLTDKAIALATWREQSRKSDPPSPLPRDDTYLPAHDDTITPAHDDMVTPAHDDFVTPINTETITIETFRKEEIVPPTPLEGAFISQWNSFSSLPKIQDWTPRRRKRLAARLQEPFFQEHWPKGIARIASSSFCREHGQHGRRVTVDWFLRSGTLTEIVEGKYDDSPVKTSKYQAPVVRADEFHSRVGKR